MPHKRAQLWLLAPSELICTAEVDLWFAAERRLIGQCAPEAVQEPLGLVHLQGLLGLSLRR